MDRSGMVGVASSHPAGPITTGDGNRGEKSLTIGNFRNVKTVATDRGSSSQEIDFIQDTSDYQWFPEYGYRDGSSILRTSVLSSLSGSSCNNKFGEFNCYEDMARDIDVNLAQVDMEDFRTEDIHSLLSTLPQTCHADAQNEQHGEMYASVSGSLMVKYDFDSSISPHSTSQEESNSSASFYKSEILFSPVKEVPLVNFSTDSLDCEEHDIMLTCQANKENYTIAFEGSTFMETSVEAQQSYSSQHNRDYFYSGSTSQEGRSTDSSSRYSLSTPRSDSVSVNKQLSTFCCIEGQPDMLVRSASPYTTWRKLKENSVESVKKESGSDNEIANSPPMQVSNVDSSCFYLKSQSLPNLSPMRNYLLRHKTRNYNRDNYLEPSGRLDGCVKLYSLSNSDYRKKRKNNAIDIENANLITRFIKQKCTKRSMDTSRFEPQEGTFEDSLVRIKGDGTEDVEMGESFSSHYGNLPQLAEKKLVKNNSANAAIDCAQEKKFLTLKTSSSSEQCCCRIVDKSIQTSLVLNGNKAKLESGDNQNDINKQPNLDKPVYVMYPNYTLPDLSFLRENMDKLDLKNIFLRPQKFTPSPTSEHTTLCEENVSRSRKRPCSCPDFDRLKNRDYDHIRDWKSLMFLLPREYCHLLMQLPELQERLRGNTEELELGRSSLCTSALQETPEIANELIEPKICVSSSSTATQPSSGYRGSSSMLLTDSSAGNTPCSPFYVYRFHNNSGIYRTSTEETKPKTAVSGMERPPLPKGILRNTAAQTSKTKKNLANMKRYSMFELGEDDENNPQKEKRRSLPSKLADGSVQRKLKREEKSSLSEDEGVESASSHCESPAPNSEQEARKLERLLQTSISWNNDDSVMQLKNQVDQTARKTVSFANLGTPPNSPVGSNTMYKPYQVKLQPAFRAPIDEEFDASNCDSSASLNYKNSLIECVSNACRQLYDAAEREESLAELALNALCPALYAVLNHGLKQTLETAFGDISNSVWQVIEASSQQGPMTRALYELVLRLNSEDVLIEGVLKFNAFIFGLLNVRGLDTWLSFLRTRESVLKKHYTERGLLVSASRGVITDRQLVDHLICVLKPLAVLPFQLDLLYECRQLHTSLMQLGKNAVPQPPVGQMCGGSNRTSWVLKKIVRSLQTASNQPTEKEAILVGDKCVIRPRSCVDSSSGFATSDVASTVKKRWSGIQFGSKLASAFERLGIEDDEEYTDSLETPRRLKKGKYADLTASDNEEDESTTLEESCSEETQIEANIRSIRGQGGKFKQLQRKWEMMATEKECQGGEFVVDDVSPSKPSDASFVISKSRIPRPVTSPIRPPTLQFGVTSYSHSSSRKSSPSSPVSNIPMLVNRRSNAMTATSKNVKQRPSTSQISRIDQPRIIRPSSLPQRVSRNTSEEKAEKTKEKCSSLNRRQTSKKFVRTLHHRLASDSGHLSYNEGERLRVVLEVDDKWLLCCRGNQKGLVPRSAVLSLPGH